MIPKEVIEIAILIREDFEALVREDPKRDAALESAWRIYNAGYRLPTQTI